MVMGVGMEGAIQVPGFTWDGSVTKSVFRLLVLCIY